MNTTITWLRYILIGFAILVLALIASVLIAQRVSDGPMGPLQGGSFETGEFVTAAVDDWSFADGKDLEFELVGTGTSRLTGLMVHNGDLYIPCDLGFMWGRFEGRTRFILNTIYVFKTWHLKAEKDGRVVLRIDGKRYEGYAVKVTDPTLVASLKAQLEEMARGWLAPAILAPAPTEGPRDIWFFRVDPTQAT